jgi:hypothetical protein
MSQSIGLIVQSHDQTDRYRYCRGHVLSSDFSTLPHALHPIASDNPSFASPQRCYDPTYRHFPSYNLP